MKELTLTISAEDANLILEALGNMPFVKVFQIINKIQVQTVPQVSNFSEATENTDLET